MLPPDVVHHSGSDSVFVEAWRGLLAVGNRVEISLTRILMVFFDFNMVLFSLYTWQKRLCAALRSQAKLVLNQQFLLPMHRAHLLRLTTLATKSCRRKQTPT